MKYEPQTSMIGILASVMMLITFGAIGQHTGKYVRKDYPKGYLLLNEDSTFKYEFRFDSHWDLACGQLEVKGDKLIFTYLSDMFDVNCNTEKINMTDTSDYFLRTGVDKRWRPLIAVAEKNKIYVIQTISTKEPEKIQKQSYYYKREKRKF